MEEGSGLLMSGILGDWCGGRLRNWRCDDEQNGARREQHTSHGMEKRSRTGAETDTRNENESRAILVGNKSWHSSAGKPHQARVVVIVHALSSSTPDRQRLPEASCTDIIDRHPVLCSLTFAYLHLSTIPPPTSSQLDRQLSQSLLNTSPQCQKPTNANGTHTFLLLLLPCAATNSSKSQNNSRLDDLAGKVSALRGITIDIYDNARDQTVIDSSVRRCFPLTIRIQQLTRHDRQMHSQTSQTACRVVLGG
jgi:hypothetical protein